MSESVRWERPVVTDWPDSLEDVRSEDRVTLILADPKRYMAQARAEARVWAQEYLREQLARRS